MSYKPCEDIFRNAFEYSTNGVAIVALNGRWLKVNRSFCNITGYSEEELLSLDFLSITHPDDLELSRKYVLELMNGQISFFQTEKRYIHKLGHTVWVMLSSNLHYDDANNPLYFISQFADITRYKCTTERKVMEQQYRSLFEYHPDAIISCDLNGRIFSCNQACEKITGYRKEELLYEWVGNFFAKDEWDKSAAHFRDTADLKPKQFDIGAIHKTGNRIDFNMTSVPLVVNNDIVGHHLIIKDMTEQKQAETVLRENDQRYRQLIKLLPEPIAVHSEGIFVYINDAGIRLVGAASQEELVGQSIFDFIHPDFHHQAANNIKQVTMGSTIGFSGYKFIRMNGEVIEVEACSTKVNEYMGRSVIQTVIRDITERKRTEELLRKSDKLSAVGQLAAGVAHEIRNPLTAIKGFVQLLQSRTNENRDYFDIMLSELERINYIVSEFMLLAKPAQVIHFEQRDIRKLIHNILSLLDTQAIMNNVQIQTEIDPDIQSIMCEENQLKQVFVNVIKNAIEAMPNGGLLVIQVRHKNKSDILIRFIDQGCGIPKERLPKLGEPFYSTKEKGTGLGLMMCFKIVEDHHGHIQIKSKPGKGTMFDIILPGE
ncbi:PAS domain S-box protein [Paenibacillus alkaliterrae]|uniref:PAS domain-containing sensor histidine kinase n=1 Tax=Paenibacillus alkaliterrae TaxID=320909 RepID=UPI001F409278|nr:PAS domain-containing sensor histidine kinase [Paenibacillus alkaliterrae]MCF2938642.1 PAS domain S-box protein [Paenibacillus alkaliterrae]